MCKDPRAEGSMTAWKNCQEASVAGEGMGLAVLGKRFCAV